VAKSQEVDAQVGDVGRTGGTLWAPSTTTIAPRAWARSAISVYGLMVPQKQFGACDSPRLWFLATASVERRRVSCVVLEWDQADPRAGVHASAGPTAEIGVVLEQRGQEISSPGFRLARPHDTGRRFSLGALRTEDQLIRVVVPTKWRLLARHLVGVGGLDR